MPARFYSKERFFTGLGSHNMVRSEPVFRTADFSEDECRALASSVQRELDELNDVYEGELYFELGPSADENLDEFIILKTKWAIHADLIETEYGKRGSCWQYDLHLLNKIANDHAKVIRALRVGELPTVYLQYDVGGGYETFDCVNSLTWDELETLESLLLNELYEMGMCFRMITDLNAEREPAEYIRAKLSWEDSEEELRNSKADKTLLAAFGAGCRCIEEIQKLRKRSVINGDGNDETNGPLRKHDDRDGSESENTDCVASENRRAGYRDPDNYWRNVWLYEQRKAGKTNATILAELVRRASDFAPLDSENALRTAIDTIAEYHRWPVVKGRPGRPKASSEPAKPRSGN